MPRYMRKRTDSDKDVIIARTVKTGKGCLEWQGATRKGKAPKFGYGHMQTYRYGNKRQTEYVHRIAYQEFIGEIPNEMLVMHTCDNPKCCNPDHLKLGSQAENMKDCRDKGRLRPRGKSKYKCVKV